MSGLTREWSSEPIAVELRLFTRRGEMMRVQVANGELKRLKDDCRFAVSPKALRRLPFQRPSND